MNPADRAYFFDEGIQFECTQCGACCTGSAGQVLVSDAEIQAIAAFRQLEIHTFAQQLLRKVADGTSLREKSNGDCVFYADGRCEIHAVKPRQCRTFPFWVKNLRNESAWEQTRSACEGIGRGRRYSKNEILEILEEDLGAGPEN
ncbi:MAG: Fe-S-cluster containining protein [Kiritimatiellia bacterium]|jgi:Fe-S-cluster containining protein